MLQKGFGGVGDGGKGCFIMEQTAPFPVPFHMYVSLRRSFNISPLLLHLGEGLLGAGKGKGYFTM